ncbi:FBD-associated F-box protein [Rhynchospora pubera]|uniref:FBD-associated F-box protein n=1 Tax=Rhynchospora pubera TaxID=906938 RepID=A0AAV8BR12_9POAL|nr:FBD-associated F-box protein [Rhynchospora pubera]
MEETVDWISSLPDDLVIKFLSFLPTKEAVQTSILSKRWRNTWAYVPILMFEYNNSRFDGDMDEDLKFEQFVDSVLQNRRASLDTVIYNCNFYLSDWKPSTEWLDRVVLLEPRVISVCVETENFECPDSVFSCASLESLKLCLYYHKDFTVVSPESLALPNLKILELEYLELGDNFMQLLFSGCPALESLKLVTCYFCASDISSNVLKNLTLERCYNGQTVRISCPGLVSLTIFSYYYFSWISLDNMASLVNADIQLEGYDEVDDDNLPNPIRLVSGLSNATHLALHLECPPELQVQLEEDMANCTTFNNLKSLKIISSYDDVIGDFNLIGCFLSHSPALQHLTLVVNCNRYKQIEARQDVYFQLEYLEKVTISCYNKNDELASKVVCMLGRYVKTIGNVFII